MPCSPSGIVAVWESAGPLNPPERTAELLVAFQEAPDRAAALEIDIGRAAELIGHGFAETFGPTAEVVLTCPECGQVLQAEVDIARSPTPPRKARDLPTPGTPRLPTVGEVAMVHGLPDAAEILRGWCLGPEIDPWDHDDGAARERAERELAELVDQASPRGPVTCPDCGTEFEATLDVAVLAWERIQDEAVRLVAEVATLARAFGWSESDILAMGTQRRAHYLSYAGGGSP